MRTYLKSLSTIIGSTLLILSSSLALGEESRGLYIVGNLSLFSEDVNARHGDGLGFGAGAGYQFNELFGLELAWDSAPAIEASTLNAHLQTQPPVPDTPNYYNVRPEANRFVSFVGTASFRTSDRFSFVGRVGVARYWRLETVHYNLRPPAGIGPAPGEVVRTNLEQQQYTPVASVGLRFKKLPKYENASIELKLTRYFKDDVKSSFFSASIKFPFPRG